MGKYWDDRKNLKYYKRIKQILDEISQGGLDSIIDIGGRDTPIVTWGNFKNRTIIELEKIKEIPGVHYTYTNFLAYQGPPVDVVTCLQVLEHLPDEIVKQFANKIIKQGKHIIISVPYQWEKGWCKQHLQDPIDLNKFFSWFDLMPLKYEIIEEIPNRMGFSRLIAQWG
jgi:hypothetical protein